MKANTDQTPSVITAGSALLAAALIRWRAEDDTFLVYVLVVAGVASLVLLLLSAVPWTRAPALTGPDGYAAALARPVSWLTGVFAAFVVALVLLQPLIGLTKDGVLAVGLIVFLGIALLGWAPTAAASAKRLSPSARPRAVVPPGRLCSTQLADAISWLVASGGPMRTKD